MVHTKCMYIVLYVLMVSMSSTYDVLWWSSETYDVVACGFSREIQCCVDLIMNVNSVDVNYLVERPWLTLYSCVGVGHNVNQ